MDLIPKPDQIAAASANLVQKLLYGGVADLRPMPRALIDEGPLRQVYHYRPAARTPQSGDPVLLVAPLAAPATCYDLRRGCSVVEHLVSQGRPTYLVEYGPVSFSDRDLAFEPWVTEVVPEAVRAASRHAGGRPVHLVGWSLGGVFGLLSSAAVPDLPIRSLTLLGTPMQPARVPPVAFDRLARKRFGLLAKPFQQVAKPLAQLAKPLGQVARLDDADFLAQAEAVERFTADTSAGPGGDFGHLYHRLLGGTELTAGAVGLQDREVRLADITVPVLVLAGASDTIAPDSCVRPLAGLVPNAAEVRFEVVPGGHLGMLTGRAARRTTWPIIDAFIAHHCGEVPGAQPGGGGRFLEAAHQAKRAAPNTGSLIGTNPERRFSSSRSRGLATTPRTPASGRGRS